MKDYYFLPSHEWFNKKDNTLGISDHAQKELGDIVFVELPEVGDMVVKGESFANVESVKAVSDVFSPVSGEVVEVNEEAMDSPELINENAFATWLIKVKDAEGAEDLMDIDQYNKTL